MKEVIKLILEHQHEIILVVINKEQRLYIEIVIKFMIH